MRFFCDFTAGRVASSSAKFGGYKEFVLAAHFEDLVRQLVAEQPDITLAEL